jgi:hypothetical protein
MLASSTRLLDPGSFTTTARQGSSRVSEGAFELQKSALKALKMLGRRQNRTPRRPRLKKPSLRGADHVSGEAALAPMLVLALGPQYANALASPGWPGAQAFADASLAVTSTTSPSRIGFAIAKNLATTSELLWAFIAASFANRS